MDFAVVKDSSVRIISFVPEIFEGVETFPEDFLTAVAACREITWFQGYIVTKSGELFSTIYKRPIKRVEEDDRLNRGTAFPMEGQKIANSHIEIARRLGVPPEDVVGGGYLSFFFSDDHLSKILVWGRSEHFGHLLVEEMPLVIEALKKLFEGVELELKVH